MDNRVCRVTDHYIDDIVVQEPVGAEEVRNHLGKYGRETKSQKALMDAGC